MRKGFAITLALALVLFACAAGADTELKSGYVYAGGPLGGEYVEGEVLLLLEAPSMIANVGSAAFDAAAFSQASSVAAAIGARVEATYTAMAAGGGEVRRLPEREWQEHRRAA